VSFSKRTKSVSNTGTNFSIGVFKKFVDRMAIGYDSTTEGTFYHAEGYVDLNTYKNYI
jgi:hypothetical protein